MIRTMLFCCLLLLGNSIAQNATAAPLRLITGNWDSKNDLTGMGDNRIFGTDGAGLRGVARESGFSPLTVLPVSGAAGGLGNFADGSERAYLSSPTGGTNGVADQLYLFNPLENSVTLIGEVVGPDGPLNMDGLAFHRDAQQLYAWSHDPIAETGQLFLVDTTALMATPLFDAPVPSNVEGIDADADTGILYAVDDRTRSISIVDPSNGLTFLADYPAGAEDIDGLAAGGGFLYLFGDGPGGSFFIYDFSEESYLLDQQGQVAAFPVPFTEAGTTSGAAYFFVPEPSMCWLTLVAWAPLWMRRRRRMPGQ